MNSGPPKVLAMEGRLNSIHWYFLIHTPNKQTIEGSPQYTSHIPKSVPPEKKPFYVQDILEVGKSKHLSSLKTCHHQQAAVSRKTSICHFAQATRGGVDCFPNSFLFFVINMSRSPNTAPS